MRIRSLCAAAVLLLAGCGASDLPKSAGLATSAPGATSWMAPEAQSEDLLYVSDEGGRVYVYSYPDGKPAGTLSGFRGPGGLCSDSLGNVFVADAQREAVLEYAHGGTKPIKEFGTFGYAAGCAVDPATGNLAVTTFQTAQPPGPGNVSVFTTTKKHGITTYTDAAFNEFFFCGYDDKGNLYVDGVNSGSQAQFAELPFGGKSLRKLELDENVVYPGGIQWDGSDVAVEDLSSAVLYRFQVGGLHGKTVGTTRFNGDHSFLLTQFWIQGKTIVLPFGKLNRDVHRIGLWPYPSGGAPTKAIEPRGAVELFGATVSLYR